LNETKANIDLKSHILTLRNDLVGSNLISDNEILLATAAAFGREDESRRWNIFGAWLQWRHFCGMTKARLIFLTCNLCGV